MDATTQKYTFHVNGMHCRSCSFIIESELKELPEVVSVQASLKDHRLIVVSSLVDKTQDDLAKYFSEFIKKHGYSLSVEKQKKDRKLGEFKIAIPVALVFLAIFVGLQKLGIVNLVDAENISYGTVFVIGIIASLSTCMAVVGGLLLSMSATFAKEGDQIKPQILFHIGRIISFFVLGGVIGVIGSAFTLNAFLNFALNLIIGIVMFVMGINLLDIFHFSKKLQPSMPKFMAQYVHGISKLNHTLTPFLVGAVTFFLPCGFTQSMQIYTLSTGNFTDGAMTMLFFALGTLPVLALISFSSLSIHKKAQSGIFFKSAGLIVILFSIFNIISGLISIGIVPPIFNF